MTDNAYADSAWSPGRRPCVEWDIDEHNCTISYGRDPGGELCALVNTRPRAYLRTVTPAQLADHARHLLMLVEDEARRGTDTGIGVSVDVRYGLTNRPFGVEGYSSLQSAREAFNALDEGDEGKVVTRTTINWPDGSIYDTDWTPVDGDA